MNGDDFRALIRKYMELRHIRTLEDLRQHTTISVATFSKYWNNPELFPWGQIISMLDALNVPYDDRLKLLQRRR
ncbi:helix-turn-helix domain-containing protein [Butyrivibrio sp. INlla18]|uniref:helix-turn-helix domain-containing protein n=1 Tax=Butyrivibrio sp. INlla18 TaxID=1520806 RepID=UPI000B88429D|nr:helix-turn-helix domain-containing protein [Butyrivibrio sp. INlla18]